ncbi:MAG: mobile mystery protein A [Bacteroidales bacterium]|nr:mobile mystery protein A [Bacteroidales bacterium]
MKKQKLILDQVERSLQSMSHLSDLIIPGSGWIHSIRQALGMSLRQLGKRMNITPQSVNEIETREKNGTVSINVLRQVASALNMKLVYGFIPKNGSLESMIEEKAAELAAMIVRRTSASMLLEDQENSEERLKKAIDEKITEIKQTMPKYLWD